MKKYILLLLVLLAFFTACENDEWDFPDFDYSTVYFAYQSPVRTITLGEDIYDTSLDNEHKFVIMATMGGVYENTNEVTIDVVVDNSLCDNLKFGSATGDDVVAMPESYYSLPADMQIRIPSGKLMGGIEVQLTDEFFADSLSIQNTYVIPMVMTSVVNADSILSGESMADNPNRIVEEDWGIAPKDYVLFAVKYINPWHGFYFRRGTEEVAFDDGSTSQFEHRAQFVEQDEVYEAVTKSLDAVEIDLRAQTDENQYIPFSMILAFDDNDDFTISSSDEESYTISGNGSFVENGDSWGEKDRNALYLQYTVDFGSSAHTMTDTMVVRNRGVSFELFDPVIALPEDDNDDGDNGDD